MSPWSVIVKKAAKIGVKQALEEYVENRIKKEILGAIKGKAYKKGARKLGNEAIKVLDLLDEKWWEILILKGFPKS